MNQSEKQEKVFVLHGYWNTPDDDGIAIVKVSAKIGPAVKALNQVAESKMKTIAILEGEGVAVQKNTEYIAFGFDVDKQEYVKIGRPVSTELLCRNRLNEAVEKGWVPESVDCTRIIFQKREVVTCTGEWEKLN